MRKIVSTICALLAAGVLAACGDEKGRAERDKEAQRAIQEGLQKERKLYEGMQKGAEGLEKKTAEQKTKN